MARKRDSAIWEELRRKQEEQRQQEEAARREQTRQATAGTIWDMQRRNNQAAPINEVGQQMYNNRPTSGNVFDLSSNRQYDAPSNQILKDSEIRERLIRLQKQKPDDDQNGKGPKGWYVAAHLKDYVSPEAAEEISEAERRRQEIISNRPTNGNVFGLTNRRTHADDRTTLPTAQDIRTGMEDYLRQRYPLPTAESVRQNLDEQFMPDYMKMRNLSGSDNQNGLPKYELPEISTERDSAREVSDMLAQTRAQWVGEETPKKELPELLTPSELRGETRNTAQSVYDFYDTQRAGQVLANEGKLRFNSLNDVTSALENEATIEGKQYVLQQYFDSLSDEEKEYLKQFDDGYLQSISGGEYAVPENGRLLSTDSRSNSSYQRMNQHEGNIKQQEAADNLRENMNLTDNGIEKLLEYRKYLLNANENQRRQEEINDLIHTGNTAADAYHSAAMTAKTVLSSPYSGVSAAFGELSGTRPELGTDVYSPYFGGVNYSENVRGNVQNRIAENGTTLGKVGAKVYSAGTSILDSELNMAVGAMTGLPALGFAGKVAGLIPFGANAYASTLKQNLEKGMPEGKAQASAVVAGLAEVGTEVFSLDHFWDLAQQESRLARNYLVNSGIQSLIEGSEEMASSAINEAYDRLVNADQSEYWKKVEEYSAYMSREEAERKAETEYLLEMAEEGFWGAVSGGVSAGVATGISVSNTNTKARQAYQNQNLIESAQALSENRSDYQNESAYDAAMKAREQADLLIKKQNAGNKITDRDLRNLYLNVNDAINTEAQTRIDNKKSIDVPESENKETRSSEDIIKEYNNLNSNLDASDIVPAMANAKSAEELVALRKIAEESSDESTKKISASAFEINKSRVISENNQTADDFTAAESMPTVKQAFNAGLSGETIPENASVSARIAFNEGQRTAIQQTAESSLNEGIAGTAMETSEGTVKLTGKITGVGENAKAETSNGSIDISKIDNKTIKYLYEAASKQTSTEAAQVFLNNYAQGMPVGRYENAFDKYYTAGATNTAAFNDLFEDDKLIRTWMNDKQLGAIYEFGEKEAKYQKDLNDAFAKMPVRAKGSGQVFDVRTNKSTEIGYMPFVEAFAKATGVDIYLTDELAANVRGKLIRGMEQVVLNTNKVGSEFQTLFHENAGEFVQAFNKEGAERIQDAILSYLADSMGQDEFTRRVKNYQQAYIAHEGGKTNYDAAGEMVNDAIAGLFSTDEGIHEFSEWSRSKYGQKESKTLLQNIADFFQGLIDALKDLVRGSKLTSASQATAQMGIEKASEIRQMILHEIDIAAENARNAEINENAPIEEAFSTDVEERSDEYAGGIRNSIDTELESMGMFYQKGQNGETIITDEYGNRITKATPDMVINSPLGAVINSAVKNGFISEEDAKKEAKFMADMVNQFMKTNDLDLVFAINSTIGFQPVQPGERTAATKNGRKSKNAGYVSNSDPQYSTTIDFTTICVKSQAIIDAMSATMKKLGRGLSEHEIIDIVYKNTHEAGEPVPCPVCYVFSRWVGLGGLFDKMKNLQVKYADADVATIRKDMADLNKQIAATQEKLTGKKTKGKAKEALYKELKEEIAPFEKLANAEKLGGKVLLTQAQRERMDLINHQLDLLDNWTWLEKVRLSKNYKAVPDEVLFDINAGTRFANEYPESWTYRTTRGPAMGKAATPYADANVGQVLRGISSPAALKNLGDLTKDSFLYVKGENGYERVKGGKLSAAASKTLNNAIKKAKVQNLLNGQRLQSTSDFRFEYLLDYLMAFHELQAAGSKVQMYTKVPESVGFMASMGAEVNLSLMPFGRGYEVDKNGNPVRDKNGNLKLLFSDVTGMHPDDAFKLSSMYDSVQPIMVGVDANHIKACMADPRISFIIPYHSSGSTESRYISMMQTVGETVESRVDYGSMETDIERPDATAEQKAARELRKDILTGNAKTLTAAQKQILRDNYYLGQMYQRFYGVDQDGNKAKIDNRFLDAADRGPNGYGAVDHNALGVFMTSKQAETIMEHEYWNKLLTIDQADQNGFAYQEYCESLGLYPRFTGHKASGGYDAEQDFSQVSGYWKTLPDRRMYNRDGTYHEQQAINVANMNLDYLDRSKTIEGIVKPSVENDRNKVEMIAQKSVDMINAEKGRYSLDVVDPIEPTSDAWKYGTTFAEAKAMYPHLYDTSGETETKRNPTQIAGTVSTYRKVYDYLKNNGFNGSILDASSGLGIGTEAGRNEYGYDVDDIEPYPSAEYEKTLRYKDYSKLFNSYDFIISNAVLNVMTQDDRDALVVKMGEMLNPGGTIFVNVRGVQDVEASKGKQPINAANHEWYMSNRSYQKGFTIPELTGYLQDALGDDYTIERATYTDEDGKRKAFPGTSVFVHKSENASMDPRYTAKPADIRYSLDLPETDFDSIFNEFQSEYDQMTLRDAGRILSEGAKHLQDLKINERAANTIAADLLKKYKSNYSKAELSEQLQKLFAFIQENPEANFGDVMQAVKEIASPVIENATEKQGVEEYERFLDAFKGRKIKLTDQQKEEVKRLWGSYQGYRLAMKGINISSTGGTDLNQMWGELAETLPDYFQYDTAEGDMPFELFDTLQALTPTVKSIYGAKNQEAAEDLAMEIMQRYFNEAATTSGDANLRDTADRMMRLNNEYREIIADRYSERYKQAKEELQEKYGHELDSKDLEIAKLKAKNAKEAAKRKEKMAAEHERHVIEVSASKLQKWAMQPTATHHIPGELLEPVMEFLQSIDFVSPQIDERSAVGGGIEYYTKMYDADQPKGHRMVTLAARTKEELYKQIAEFVEAGKGRKYQRHWSEKMASIKDLYDQVAKGAQFNDHNMDDLVHSLDKSLADDLKDVFNRNKGTLRVSQLNSDDLKVIKRAIENLSHSILVANKAFTMPSKEISALANDTMKSVNKHTARKERTKFGNRVVDFLTLDMATPKTYFSMANSDGVYKILRKALNKKISNVRKAQAEFEKIIEGVDEKTRKSWDEVKTYNIRGQEFQMNDKQLMSLYELNKRQQAMVHMPGGITITTLDVKKNGLLGKLGVKVQHTQFKPVHLTASEIKELVSNLTDQQKDIADKMQHYMATECSKWGNQAARLMYGYEKFTEENYFPIKTDRNSISMQASNVSQLYNAIADMGFTKQVKPGARNALVISDIFDVFSDHVADMATYNAYAPAIADVLRWYNFRTTDTDAANNFDHTQAVQAAIQELMGVGGKNYFSKLIRDINEQEQSSYIGGFWSNLTSRYKVAAVGANIRVVAQQPTAIVRARNLIDDKYIIRGLSTVANFKESTKHAIDLSEIAWWKSQGFYESNIGPTMKKILTGDSTAIEKLQEKSLALAGLADDFGYSVLYRAVELEQADKFKAAGLKITGEDEAAYRQAVNDRYDDVIDETQVVDSTLHRSQFMRSTDAFNKLQSAFMAEPTKSYNMLMKAASDAYKSAEGDGVKALASVAKSKVFKRAAVSFVATNVVNAAVQSFIDAMRSARRDDDKDYWERFAAAMLENTKDDLNPANLMPWVKDVADIISNAKKQLEGESTYSSNNSRMDLAAIQNFANAAVNTIKYLQGKGSKTGFGVAYSDLQALSQLTGVPVYNLTRDVAALYDSIRHKYFYELPNIFETSTSNAKTVAKSRVFKAIDEGGDFKQAIEYAEKVGVNISVNGLVTSITNKYKDEYPALLETDPNAAIILKNRLEQVYTYLYDLEGKEFKGRKWLTDAIEEEPEAENETIDLTEEDYGTEAGSRATYSSEPIGYTPMDDWDYSSSINSEFEENPTAANFGAYRDMYPAVMGEVREKPIERSQTGPAYLTSEYAEQNREALTDIIAGAKTDNGKNGLYTIGEFVKAMEDRGAVFYDMEELNVRYNEYLNSVTTFGNSREKHVTEGSTDVHIRETDRDIRGMAKYEHPKPGFSSYSPEQWAYLMHGFNTNQQVLHNMEEKNQDALAEIVAEYKTSNNPTIMSKQKFADVLQMKGGFLLNEDNVNALYQAYMNDVNTFGRRREKRIREGTANVRARDIPAEDWRPNMPAFMYDVNYQNLSPSQFGYWMNAYWDQRNFR